MSVIPDTHISSMLGQNDRRSVALLHSDAAHLYGATAGAVDRALVQVKLVQLTADNPLRNDDA